VLKLLEPNENTKKVVLEKKKLGRRNRDGEVDFTTWQQDSYELHLEKSCGKIFWFEKIATKAVAKYFDLKKLPQKL